MATDSCNISAQLLAAHVITVLWQVARIVNVVDLIPNQIAYLYIKGTLRVHFCSSDKTELSELAVCDSLTFSDGLGGRNGSAVLHVVDTNLNTSALQCVTQC